MDRLQAMQVFVHVVELGTFAAAANALGLHRPAVTLAIQQLERTLDVALLIRNTRNVNVTPEGETFYRRCVTLLADVDEAFSDYSKTPIDPVGRLHIDITAIVGHTLIIPALAAFQARYPRITLAIGTSDRAIDMHAEGVDCLVRLGTLKPQGLTAQKVGTLAMVTCAAPAYFERYGTPKRIGDLEKHVAVNIVGGPSRRTREWVFLENRKETRKRLESAVVVDDSAALLSCALSGFGLIQAPRQAIAPYLEDSRLVEVLPRTPAAPSDVTVIYPPQTRLPPQTAAFIAWLDDLLAGRHAPV